jgi:YggT family protein
MSAIEFLISTLFGLYLMVVLLRLWLQLAQADFYNPFSKFVVKATHPLVGPLRRILPPIGRLDTASLVLALLVAALKVFTVTLVIYGVVMTNPLAIFIQAFFTVLYETFQLVFYVLIIRAIFSFVSQGQNPLEQVFQQLTEPFLAPIRRVLPPMGGLDFSVMVAIIALLFLQKLMAEFVRYI